MVWCVVNRCVCVCGVFVGVLGRGVCGWWGWGGGGGGGVGWGGGGGMRDNRLEIVSISHHQEVMC